MATVADSMLAPGARRVWDLTRYFEDLDGQEMTHSVAASDTSVVAVTVAEWTLGAAGLAEGAATVTVTATEAIGHAATQ